MDTPTHQEPTMRSLLPLALLVIAAPAFADQGIGLSPVINDLSSTTRVSTVQVSNQTDCAAPFQFTVQRWIQKDGVDIETPTDAVRATPPIATIPAGATQTVRIFRIAPPNLAGEETYRLDIKQIAGACPTKLGAGPTVNLKWHLQEPIFYRDPAWKPEIHAEWANGGLKLRNAGKATAHIFGVHVGDTAWASRSVYIQPGDSIDVAPKSGPSSKPAVINVRTSPTIDTAITVE
jgi:fimbrial chaperone protein